MLATSGRVRVLGPCRAQVWQRMRFCWRGRIGVVCVALAVVLASGLAEAQVPDPLEEARFRFGSFGFTPAFFMLGGYDSNVQRTAAGKGDQEFVTSPQLQTWLSLGRLLLYGHGAAELTLYHQDPPVTFNYANNISLTVPGALLEPKLRYSHRNLYAPPTGFEYGEKSRRVEDELVGGLDWHLGAYSTLSVEGNRSIIDYDAAATYQDSNLREFLNRTSTSGSVSAGTEVTPLTSVFAMARVIYDRFEFSPERNGDSLDVLGGVTFKTPALISGSAVVGYRHFESPTSGAMNFNGLVTTAHLVYARESRTSVVFDLIREPFYSYSESLGYYLLTSARGVYIQALSQNWETAVFGGYHLLDYRVSGLPTGADALTKVTDLGGGVSRRAGAYTRIGVNASWEESRGETQYRAWRMIAYIVYGADKLLRLDRPLPDTR